MKETVKSPANAQLPDILGGNGMVQMSRREFLARTGAAVGAAAVGSVLSIPAVGAPRKISANDKIVMGCIGMGGMGMANMDHFLNMADVEVAAVCDVDSARVDHAAAEVEKRKGKAPEKIHDFRKLLERKDIDAVVISTPDHWHALPMILACEAGKDVYVEKPIGHDIVEGKAMVGAAKKYGSVVQVGTWQRSAQHYHDAMKFVQAGKLGKINLVRAWTVSGATPGNPKPCAAPRNLDWDFWIGPAKWEPFRPCFHPGHFRWFFNFAAGLTGDWGVHMLDTVGTFMNEWHPQEVASYGGKLACAPDDIRTTPDTQIAIYKFPNWILQWEIHVHGAGLDGGGGHGAEFIGSEGTLRIDRGGWNFDKGQENGPKTVEQLPTDHWQDFVQCVRTRAKPRSDIESMHYATCLCHLANAAYLLGRSIKWDGARGEIIGDKAAMQCQSYQREYRKPWTLPRHDLERS